MNHLRLPFPAPSSCSVSFRRSKSSDTYASRSQGWTTLLSTYTFFLTNRTTRPPPSLFPELLTSTSFPSDFGPMLHTHTILLGYTQDPYISSSLLSMYSKSGNVNTARKVFDVMPTKTVVPWTAMIGAYGQIKDTENAFSLFREMRRDGIEPNSVTALGLLSAVVSELDLVMCLHSWVINCGFDSDVVVVNKMLDVYLKCEGGIHLARNLFENMHSNRRRDVVTWNSMISGYSKDSDLRECVLLFHKMRKEDGINPDHQTFGSILPLATTSGDHLRSVQVLREVHAQIITTGFYSHIHLCTTLMTMYMKCKDLDSGLILFRRTPQKDVIFWTSMISGLIRNERSDEAMSIFRIMLQEGVTPSNATLATLLAGCADLGSNSYGISIHGHIVRQGITLDRVAKNSLVTLYAKCGRISSSRICFDSIPDKDVVSWNAMVSAYGQNGYLQDAANLFTEMRYSSNIQPDQITTVALLQASAALGILQFGRSIHCFIIQTIELSGIAITTALLDMYSKSGDLSSAQRCFDGSNHHDVISWTAIISAYGINGIGEAAIRLYSEFLQTNQKPNHIMLLTVLNACAHAGLVQAGLEIYQAMIRNFCIEPTVEHLACIIDLLCRAGMISEALTVLKSTSHPPNADVLGILLDACRHHKTNAGNDLTSTEIASEMAAMNLTSAGSYVQLAQSHAAGRRWDCVEESWMRMRSLGLRKTPAWSFIDLNGAITSFFSGHDSHPRYEEILSVLWILDGEMKARQINDTFSMNGL
ncbi:hypothetical protein ZOSMA_209G00200 [Zostera marina]|uniref:Pentatricopeptide repeat-containing protein n=1 Tax=Zostera marina TaxID=29655 RepID=A0A0K9PN98_ZOSMR|nr:hypothetical protein ZOSMA_209G00200 [Zostera marina]